MSTSNDHQTVTIEAPAWLDDPKAIQFLHALKLDPDRLCLEEDGLLHCCRQGSDETHPAPVETLLAAAGILKTEPVVVAKEEKPEAPSSKTCRTCETTKPLSSFRKHTGMADGYMSNCMTCQVRARRARKAAFEASAALVGKTSAPRPGGRLDTFLKTGRAR
ncbi:hypothetical protein [Variovorax soli]|uniref:hypothetical protein n=1 Tax=Variovorax soli TaxID=376815 RepID=UPI00083912E0|nr:hypothetical protein [Variovorax soli]